MTIITNNLIRNSIKNFGIENPKNLRFKSVIGKVLQMFSRDPETGKITGKILADTDWYEFFDPLHRRASSIRKYFQEWATNDELKTKTSFFDYMDMLANSTPDHPLSSPSIQIVYMSPEQRAQYRVTVESNVSKKAIFKDINGKNLEDGCYISVLGPDNQLYIAKEISGKLHHSSFFSGKSILAPGELVVKDGVLIEYAGMSGHYKPSKKEDSYFLNYLKDQGVDLQTFRYTTLSSRKVAKNALKKHSPVTIASN